MSTTAFDAYAENKEDCQNGESEIPSVRDGVSTTARLPQPT